MVDRQETKAILHVPRPPLSEVDPPAKRDEAEMRRWRLEGCAITADGLPARRSGDRAVVSEPRKLREIKQDAG